MKELIELYGGPIALYNRIKHIEPATTKSESVSYVLADERRFLIHVRDLKALCFDQLMKHSFSTQEIAVTIDLLKNAPIRFPEPLKTKITNRLIDIIKLLKE